MAVEGFLWGIPVINNYPLGEKMEFFKKRSTAWRILAIVVVCSFFIGQGKRPADKIEILPSGVYVQDNADILSDSTEKYMTELNNGLVSRVGAEIQVVTVNTTGGQDIFETAIDVGVKTNLSRNSCVFLIAADDTDCVVVQGEDLLYAFPDDVLTAILQNNFTVQDFRARNLDSPAKETFRDLIEMYEDYYNVTIAGSTTVEKVTGTGTSGMSASMMAVIFFILFIMLLVLIVSAPRRRRTVITPVGRTYVPPRTGYNPPRGYTPPRNTGSFGGGRNTTSFGGNSRTGGFGSSTRGGSFSGSSRGGSFGSSSRSGFGGSSRSGGFGSSSRGGSFGGSRGGSRGGGFRSR